MLWPELGLHIKFLMVVGLSGLMIFSCFVVVCFIIPDSWICLRFWPGANEDDDEEEEIWIKRNANGIGRRKSLSKVVLRNQNQKEFINESITSEEHITKPSAILLDESKIVNGSSSKSTAIHRPSTTDYSSGSSTDESCSVTTSKDHDHHQHQPETDGAGEETLSGPQLHLTLQWDRRPIGSSFQQLIVEIEKGTELPWRYYARTVDPSVSSVRLEEVRKSRSGLFRNLLNRKSSNREDLEGRIIVQVQPNNDGSDEDNSSAAYSCVQHDRNPQFQQTIQLSFPASIPTQDCRVVIVLADNDKLIGIREIGQCRIDLNSVNHHQDEEKIDAPKLIRLVCPISIAACQQHFKGEIYLGLSFLPTSQRITVQIDRIKIPLIGKKRDFKARIRLYLLNESGRLLKKRKTLPLECSTFPVNTSSSAPSILLECNELFHLDVGIERWEKSVILAVLMIGDVEDVYQPKGFVALGKAIQGSSERIHWESAFQAPRQIFSQWHSFR